MKSLFPPETLEPAPTVIPNLAVHSHEEMLPKGTKLGGASFGVSDAPLIERGIAGLRDGTWKSAHEAGCFLASQAKGGGSDESKAKRIGGGIRKRLKETENG